MEVGGANMSGSSHAQGHGDNTKIQKTKEQVDEIVGIMKVNMQKVIDRDHKLSELDERADALQNGASQFSQHSTRLRTKYWWKNTRMTIIIAVIVAIFIGLIIYWAV